jgi:hypothetical protein
VSDLAQFSDEEIITHGLYAPLKMLLKHSKDGDLELIVKNYQDVFIAYIAALGNDYLFSILNYIDSIEDITVGKKLHKLVGGAYENKKDIITTYGQLLGQEPKNRGMEKGMGKDIEIGFQNGMQTEKLQIAKGMFRGGLEFAIIQKLTGLSLGELQTSR